MDRFNNKVFFKKIKKIYNGWKIWHRAIKKYQIIEKDALILMPSIDKEINTYVLKYLDRYLMSVGKQTAILFVTPANRDILEFSLARNIRKIIVVSEKQMKNIVEYYAACNLERRMVVADIDCIPIRKAARKLIGINGLTLEELVSVGLYHLI